MYAIISTGGKQAKVSEGDVLSVELINDTGALSYTPLLIVKDDGSVIADPAKLEKASVTAEVLAESAGPKIDIFKYKNKTGYRRRIGHRQKYTTIKVTGIKAPGGKKKSTKDSKAAKSKKDAKPAEATKDSKAAKSKKDAKPAEATKDSKAAKSKKDAKPEKASDVSGDTGDQEA